VFLFKACMETVFAGGPEKPSDTLLRLPFAALLLPAMRARPRRLRENTITGRRNP
jgi:hypothetical protein